MLMQVVTQKRHDAVEVLAAQHGHMPKHTRRRLQGKARMRGADVGQQARAIGKGGARELFRRVPAPHQFSVPNQAP